MSFCVSVGLALGSLCFNAQGCVPALLENQHGLSCSGAVGSWVELDLFSLKCNEVSSSEFWGVYGFGMALGSLCFNAQACVPTLLENQRGLSCSGTCWLLGGAWFQCGYGGFWMSSCLLMFSGMRSSLVFSSFGI